MKTFLELTEGDTLYYVSIKGEYHTEEIKSIKPTYNHLFIKTTSHRIRVDIHRTEFNTREYSLYINKDDALKKLSSYEKISRS